MSRGSHLLLGDGPNHRDFVKTRPRAYLKLCLGCVYQMTQNATMTSHLFGGCFQNKNPKCWPACGEVGTFVGPRRGAPPAESRTEVPRQLSRTTMHPRSPTPGSAPKRTETRVLGRAALPGAERHHPQQPRHRAGLSAHGQAVKRGGVVRLSGIQPSTAGNSARWEPMGELTGHYAK